MLIDLCIHNSKQIIGITGLLILPRKVLVLTLLKNALEQQVSHPLKDNTGGERDG